MQRGTQTLRKLAVGLTVLALWGPAPRATTLTWQIQGSNPAEWNTAVDNWLPGPTLYTNGGVDDVIFNNTTQAAGAVYIGTGATPANVTPKSLQFTGGTGVHFTWTLTGGNIQGTTSLKCDWDRYVHIATNRSFDFSGGIDLAGGALYFEPNTPDTYQLGSAPISLAGRGVSLSFYFAPSVAGCTLTNDMTVPAAGGYLNVPTNAGVLSGTITLNGPLTVSSPAGAAVATALALAGGPQTVTLSVPNNTSFRSPVSGGAVLTLSKSGNTTAWTDYWCVVDSAATWSVSGFTKDGTGNLSFLNPRALGSTVTLRTGAVIMGGSASDEDWIPNAATLNFTGGKLFLRDDQPAGAKTETVGAIGFNSAYSELRINSLGGGPHTLQSTGALTRSNDATALVVMGTGTQIVLPGSPALFGGGGAAGTTTISIVPWLAGGTQTADSDRVISGSTDFGSTLITFDAGTMSLRPLNTASEFAAAIAGAGATENVRKTADETLAANASVNALVVAATTPRTLDGAYKLTLNSGTLLTTSTSWANSITIATNQLDFNGGEANIFVTGSNYAQVRTIIASDITNASKVIKSGFGALYLTGDSTFTGPLVVNSGGLSGNNNEGLLLRGTLATTDVRILRDAMVLEAVGDNRLNPNTVLMVNAGGALKTNCGQASDPTTFTQTIRGLVDGPDGGGTVGGGVYNWGSSYMVNRATLNLILNPAAGDNFMFSGVFSNANSSPLHVIKAGAGTQTFAGLSGATSVEFRDGLVVNTVASRGGTYRFNGGFYTTGVSNGMRDWNWGTTGNAWHAVGDVCLAANYVSYNMGPAGPTTYQWGVAPFLLDGKRLAFNQPESIAYVGFEFNFSLGNTAGTPELREVFVNDNPATAADYGQLSGVISGTASDKTLLKTGPGTLVLTNNNTYAGPTRVDAGVLRLNAANALPGGINATGGTSHLILNGGVLGLGNGNFLRGLGTGNTQVEFTGSGGFAAYGVDRNVNLGNASATVQWNAGSFVPAGSALILGAGDATHTLIFQNPIDLNGGQRTVQTDNGAAAVDGRITGILSDSVGGAGLTKTGLGTLELTAVNPYTGPTLIQGGTLQLSTTGRINNTSAVIVGAGAVFNPTAAGGWNPGAGQTLGGNGTVIGNTSATGTGAGSRASVAPGESIGTLTIAGNMTFADFSTLAIELGEAGVSDQLVVNGSLNLGSSTDRLDLSLAGTGMMGAYTLATWTGSLTGEFSEVYYAGSPVADGAYIGGNYWLVYGANSLTLVPEPGMLAGLALGAALLLRRRRV